eukprot:5596751-Pleurochrysis_carterae.AAC.1
MASFAASEAATISASHEDNATVGCFLEAQDMAACPYRNTYPDVEWRGDVSQTDGAVKIEVHQDAACVVE